MNEGLSEMKHPMDELDLDPWNGERYEYGEVHEIAVKLTVETHGYRTIVVREGGIQRAPDPNVIGTLNRLGAAGWMINPAEMHGQAAIEANPWLMERAREMDQNAISIYYWKSRAMMRRLPYRDELGQPES